jgi:hypothetical protein
MRDYRQGAVELRTSRVDPPRVGEAPLDTKIAWASASS